LSECVFLKIGGSIITDKSTSMTFAEDVAVRLGGEIRRAREASDFRLIIGHGAGSFGHFAAAKFATHQGLAGGGGWEGFAQTRMAVMQLNLLLLQAWRKAGFFPMPVSPASCAFRDNDGAVQFNCDALQAMLDAGQTPMVFGDAICDRRQGFCIAGTEDVFGAIARKIRPTRIILACNVDGVFEEDPLVNAKAARIAVINDSNADRICGKSCAADARDVTGRMAGKIQRLRELARRVSVQEIRIISGLKPGAVYEALLGKYAGGTVIK
jgi:isopentenyl phosphate kinase